MTGNQRNTAKVADQIANGDLTVTPKPMSDKDMLGMALQSMVERLRGVVSNAISAADDVSSGIEPVFSFTFKRNILMSDGSRHQEEVSGSAWRLYRRLHGEDDALAGLFRRWAATDAGRSRGDAGGGAEIRR